MSEYLLSSAYAVWHKSVIGAKIGPGYETLNYPPNETVLYILMYTNV